RLGGAHLLPRANGVLRGPPRCIEPRRARGAARLRARLGAKRAARRSAVVLACGQAGAPEARRAPCPKVLRTRGRLRAKARDAGVRRAVSRRARPLRARRSSVRDGLCGLALAKG